MEIKIHFAWSTIRMNKKMWVKKRTHQHIYPHMSKANKIPMDFRKLNVSKLRGAKNE